MRKFGARVLTLDQVYGVKDPSIECWGTEEEDGGDPPRLWAPNGNYPGTAFTRSIGDNGECSSGMAIPLLTCSHGSESFLDVLQLLRQLECALSQSLLSGISLQPILSSSLAAMAFLSLCPVRQLWTWWGPSQPSLLQLDATQKISHMHVCSFKLCLVLEKCNK